MMNAFRARGVSLQSYICLFCTSHLDLIQERLVPQLLMAMLDLSADVDFPDLAFPLIPSRPPPDTQTNTYTLQYRPALRFLHVS